MEIAGFGCCTTAGIAQLQDDVVDGVGAGRARGPRVRVATTREHIHVEAQNPDTARVDSRTVDVFGDEQSVDTEVIGAQHCNRLSAVGASTGDEHGSTGVLMCARDRHEFREGR